MNVRVTYEQGFPTLLHNYTRLASLIGGSANPSPSSPWPPGGGS